MYHPNHIIRIEVNPTRFMYFYFHDPHFFTLTVNEDVVPNGKVLMKPSKGNGMISLWVMIRPVFHVNMDREGSFIMQAFYLSSVYFIVNTRSKMQL